MFDEPTPPAPKVADAPENERAVIGDNHPPKATPYDPAVLADFSARTDKFIGVAAAWLDLSEIETEEDAKRLNDFVSGARKAKKTIDEARAAAKKPHDDAGKMVQAAFTPLMEKLDRAMKRAAPLLNAWADKLAALQRAEAARKAAVAEAARVEAERLATEAAASTDVGAEVDAEAAMKAANKLTKEAARAAAAPVQVGSATGGGRTASLREYREAKITNLRVLFMHYCDHPDVAECLKRLADADIRAKDVDETKIPGIEIITERKMV